MSQEILTTNNKNAMVNENSSKPEKLNNKGKAITYLHLYLYLAVMGLLTLIWVLGAMRRGLYFFWPMFPMFGWGFACGYQYILYLAYNDKNQFLSNLRKKPYFGISFITHMWFYVSVNIFLVVLNVLFSRFPWSVFPIIGWGMVFGAHFILASTLGKPNEIKVKEPSQPKIKPVEIDKTNYCHTCGANISDRQNAKFCSFCGSILD
ncbi:MAG: 2TM domain-containing protein [Candidatus Hermodarchaeota archaeon]